MNRRECIGSFEHSSIKNTYEKEGNPEGYSRMAQYEMAYRMQTSVPETMDISQEPDSYF